METGTLTAPLRKIGAGGTAEVFALPDDRVLKLFRSFMPREAARREYGSAREAARRGLPTPEALAFVRARGRDGIVYRRVRGASLLRRMLLPWGTARCARLLASLQADIHAHGAEGFPSCRRELARNIARCPLLREEEKAGLYGRLRDLPEGDRLCHGDFHPDNVLLTADGPVILDWMTACAGDPAADVARTGLILLTSELPGGLPRPLRLYVERRRRKLHAAYLAEYCRLTGMTRARIDAWRLPVAAARLTERRPEAENARLLALLRAESGDGG